MRKALIFVATVGTLIALSAAPALAQPLDSSPATGVVGDVVTVSPQFDPCPTEAVLVGLWSPGTTLDIDAPFQQTPITLDPADSADDMWTAVVGPFDAPGTWTVRAICLVSLPSLENFRYEPLSLTVRRSGPPTTNPPTSAPTTAPPATAPPTVAPTAAPVTAAAAPAAAAADDALPRTGAGSTLWLVLVGLGVLGAGALVGGLSRRPAAQQRR
jgi:LPXTG-motif cell wall-anchored protein